MSNLTCDVVAVHGALGAAQLEIKALRATIVERDASIARLTIRLAADDQDATIERLQAALAELRASLTPERRPRFQGHSDGFNDGLTLAADRLVTPWVEIPDEVLSDEAIESLRARFMTPIEERPTSCPDSCGGQSWTGVNTNYGRRWRCDTCHRIISRYVTDAIQAADDRRSL